MAYAFFGTLVILFSMKTAVFLFLLCKGPRKSFWAVKGSAFGPQGRPLEDEVEAIELHEVRADRIDRENEQKRMKSEYRQMRRDIDDLLKREEQRLRTGGGGPANGGHQQGTLTHARAPSGGVRQPQSDQVYLNSSSGNIASSSMVSSSAPSGGEQ